MVVKRLQSIIDYTVLEQYLYCTLGEESLRGGHKGREIHRERERYTQRERERGRKRVAHGERNKESAGDRREWGRTAVGNREKKQERR